MRGAMSLGSRTTCSNVFQWQCRLLEVLFLGQNRHKPVVCCQFCAFGVKCCQMLGMEA